MCSIKSLLVVVVHISGCAQALRLNGWYPCGVTDVDPSNVAADSASFECAKVEVPLCHPEVCSGTKTIEVFVKRIVANETNTAHASVPTLWLLEGGPGASSAACK